MFGRNSAEVMCFRKFGHGGFFGAKKGRKLRLVQTYCSPKLSTWVFLIGRFSHHFQQNHFHWIKHTGFFPFPMFKALKKWVWDYDGSIHFQWLAAMLGYLKANPLWHVSFQGTNLHNFALQCAMREWQCIFPRQWRNLWVSGWWILKALATLKIS